MTNEPKRRLPMVPGPDGAAQAYPGQQERPASEQKLADYERDKLDRELDRQRALARAGEHAANHPAPMDFHPLPKTVFPTVPPLPKTVKAVAAVMAEIGTIKKGGFNKFYGYAYARMEDMLQKATPLMGKHGIMVRQTEISRSILENRIVIDYGFRTYVEDEVSPVDRQPGMCMARDSKGNIDDKALLKCHTQARKYYLLSLFQIPAGDFDDNDEDEPAKEKEAVPGPTRRPPVDESKPHKLILGRGAGVTEWAGKYIQKIGNAANEEELRAWDNENDSALQSISELNPEIYERISLAAQRRLQDIKAPRMPSPRADAQIAVNWTAQQLADFETYEAAEKFWNEVIAPRESEFTPIDFDVLLAEWRRAEARLSPPHDKDGEISDG